MSLDSLRALYFPSEINIDKELFLPLSRSSHSLRCMSGYFRSGVLAELAQSILCYVNSNEAPIKFIISPNLNLEDTQALLDAQAAGEDILEKLWPNFALEENTLRHRTLDAFLYLVATGKIELKIAVMEHGLFHAKVWLFETEKGVASVHGSSNATQQGLTKNFEQLYLSRSWMGQEALSTCNEFVARFEKIWNGTHQDILTFPVNDQTLRTIKRYSTSKENDTKKLFKNLKDEYEDYLDELWYANIDRPILKIPSYLTYRRGAYAHQGAAVDAWLEQGKGILSIATGGGKTLTSLIAASKVNKQTGKLFLVIAVPTIALLNQWASDVKSFGIHPINTFSQTKSETRHQINISLRQLRFEVSHCEVLIITHDALKSDLLDVFEGPKYSDLNFMLIGDEVHNLGSKGFIRKSPQFFKYRLGLSATYKRQFDDEGTRFLVDYFGPVVYEFSLESAIGNCLVPYDYIVHKVYLTASEEDDFLEITEKIKQLAYAANFPDGHHDKDRWNMLCIQRRRIIEGAENKLSVFREVFDSIEKKQRIEKALVFCTDKDHQLLDSINAYLNEKSILWHQVTSTETSKPELLNTIIAGFRNNQYQVLTAMRVLDEGFNIPQTELAFLLASNTVERQWIQRLGRVLRLSNDTGKKKAIIHDFIVLPSISQQGMDKDLKSLIRSECNRVLFFARLSNNITSNDSAINEISEIILKLEDK